MADKPRFVPGDKVLVYRSRKQRWFHGRVVDGPRLMGQWNAWKVAVEGEYVDRWYRAYNLKEEVESE